MSDACLKRNSNGRWLSLIICVMLSTIPLTSCVTNNDVTYLNDQIINLDKRVANLEGSLDEKLNQELGEKLRSILANQATLSADMDQLREQIKDLSGRAEDNEHVIRQIVERDLGDLNAIKTGYSDISQRLANLEIRVLGESQAKKPAQIPAEEKEKQASLKSESEQKVTPVMPAVPVESESKELALYNTSLAAYKAGNYEESIKNFKEFLRIYPKSDLADNAHFWIGESYLALKQYEQAILAFQEVIKNYPKGNKVPGALLKQAMAFLEIKDKTSSSLLLQKIIKNYPNSNEAKIARAKLDALK